MNTLLNPFLERFRHPIFSSVVVSFSIRNWDHLLPLSAAIIHPKEIGFSAHYNDFLFALFSEQISRILFPMFAGVFVAFIGLPISDWAYSAVLSKILRRKANTVNSEENKVIVVKAKNRERVIQSILENVQNRTLINCINYLSVGAEFGFFKPASDVVEGSFVRYNSENGTVIVAKHSRGPILGFVYKVLSPEIALVVSSGIISDSDFLGDHFQGNPGGITVGRHGKGVSTDQSQYLVASVSRNTNGILQLTLAISQSEFSLVNSDYVQRLSIN